MSSGSAQYSANRAHMRAVAREIPRVQLDEYRLARCRDAYRAWLEGYQQKLRACCGLGAIDPGPQNPRW